MSTKITQRGIVLEFYRNNPGRDIETPEAVDWAVSEYKKRTGKIFRDPDRQIRSLYSEGYLIKIKNGLYRYDPKQIRTLENFTAAQKAEIFRRDGYKCVVCGLGEREGLSMHADHIKPRARGGVSTVENGQTLCSKHNFRKRHYNQTEVSKKMFIRLLERSSKVHDRELAEFCKDILRAYEKHDINGHIEWNDD